MALAKIVIEDLKMTREVLCMALSFTNLKDSEKKLVQDLIDKIDIHRPLGSDGKHGYLHTSTCGCDGVVNDGVILGIVKKLDEHVCRPPKEPIAKLGMVWRCSCGKAYRYEIDASQYKRHKNDRLRNGYWEEWVRIESYDRDFGVPNDLHS